MKSITLSGKKAAGRIVLIDDADYGRLTPHTWGVLEGHRAGLPYGPYAITHLVVDGQRRRILMHGLITGYARTDHADGNGLNNQRYNLRDATNSQNLANQGKRPGCTSRYKGVYWNADREKWQAQIAVNGHHRNLGRFYDEIEAAKAYDAAALAAWGEFARLNLPGANSGLALPAR